jgi:hypothetical protein
VQAAAAARAAGEAAGDESRLSRARVSHWAPVLRAQVGGTSGQKDRVGQQSGTPLHWDELDGAGTWLVAAIWDLSQLVYDRDENQLALSSVHLARRRQEAAEEAGRLFVERALTLRVLREAPPEGRAAAALELLRCTGALDALTGGLFAAQLAAAQRAADRFLATPAPKEIK